MSARPSSPVVRRAREHRQLVARAEAAERRAHLLNRAIRVHQRMIQGPGPVAEFGLADAELWAARQRITNRKAAA